MHKKTNALEPAADCEAKHDAAIEGLVQAYGKRSKQALALWRHRRVSWSITADRLQRRLECAARAARTAAPWEHLYVMRDDASRSLRLFYGIHPVPGIVEGDLEMGASIVISQSTQGEVAVLFFPFESSNVRQKKVKLIWSHYDGPQQINDFEIRRMLVDFLGYSIATSAIMGSTPRERKLLDRLEYRSRILEGGAERAGLHWPAVATLVIGSIATAALLVAWILTGKAEIEPWVGLVALGTGWIAAWVQRSQDTFDRQLTSAMEVERIEKSERDRRSKAIRQHNDRRF